MNGNVLNSTAASILGLLHREPMTGWDLVNAAETLIGDFWSLAQSQVYRELAAMEQAGLVVAEQPGPRARRPYSVTDAGRAAFAAWVNTEPGQETIRFPLLLSIGFGRHIDPDRLATYITRHRARHAERLAGYEQQARRAAEGGRTPDPHRQATLRFGLAYERMVLDWFDTLPQEITGSDPSVDGGAAGAVDAAPGGPGR